MIGHIDDGSLYSVTKVADFPEGERLQCAAAPAPPAPASPLAIEDMAGIFIIHAVGLGIALLIHTASRLARRSVREHLFSGTSPLLRASTSIWPPCVSKRHTPLRACRRRAEAGGGEADQTEEAGKKDQEAAPEASAEGKGASKEAIRISNLVTEARCRHLVQMVPPPPRLS